MQDLSTREINKIAQNIFHDSIPPAWLIRGQEPDYHIDYFVEIADKKGPTGTVFGIQLKGTASPKYAKNHIKLFMKTKHISYYLDKVKQPIFIIIIDIINKIGYYSFIQEWLNGPINKNWRNAKTMAINIPCDNLINDAENFRKAIYHAENYMRDLWPSSIIASINYEKNRLKNLDPRFKISVSHIDGHTRYGLRPKENINFKIIFKNSKIFQKGVIDFYKRGMPFSIEIDQIRKIEGSKILEEAFEKSIQGKLTIEPSQKINSYIILYTFNELNQETSILYNINGTILGGKNEFCFQGGIQDSPLKIKILGKFAKIGLKLEYKINFEYKKWEGLSVKILPFFDRLYSFFKSIINGDNIKLICEIKGQQFFEVIFNIIDGEINIIYNYLNLLHKARIIALDNNIDLILPKYNLISKYDINNIELIYDLIMQEEYRQVRSNAIINAEIIPNENFYEKFGKEDNEKYLSMPLNIEVPDSKFNIFGSEIRLGPLRYILTNPKIIIKKINNGKNIKNRKRQIILEGTKNSELIVTKIQEK